MFFSGHSTELKLDFENLTYATMEPFAFVCLEKDGDTLDDISIEVLYSTVAFRGKSLGLYNDNYYNRQF